MIHCNGSPKTGTHLLVKSVRMFNCVIASHNHNPELSPTKHIHIRRNPRNAIISYLRMDKTELTSKNIISKMKLFIDEYSQYVHLLSDKNILNVSFEDLLTDENELKRIADFIGFPLVDNHFKMLWGNTATFTGSLSNWRDYWCRDIIKAWSELGGVELENSLGYNPDTDKIKVRKP